MKNLFTFLFLLSVSTTLSAQGIVFEKEETPWADLLQKAKTENKIIFVDAYTTWCSPCKFMASNVFTLKQVGQAYNARFINAKIDMESGEGLALAKKYVVTAYPTYIFVDGNGELVHRGVGTLTVEKFIALGESAADVEHQFSALKIRYEAGERAPDFLLRFANACQDMQDKNLVQPVGDAYLATQKDWLTPENKDFIVRFATHIESSAFNFLVNNKAFFISEDNALNLDKQIEQIALDGIKDATFNRQKKEFDFVKVKELGEKHLSPELSDKVFSILTLEQYRMKRQFAPMLDHIVGHLNKYPSENPMELNHFAWLFYENAREPAQLETAINWSIKAISLSEQYVFKYTAACLYFKSGNKKKAKEYAEKTIAQAKLTGEDYENTEKLLVKINAM